MDRPHSPPEEKEDKNSTWRLHEGISHPSRADNLQDLHRLQTSSTKPRAGVHRASQSICPCTLFIHLTEFVWCRQ